MPARHPAIRALLVGVCGITTLLAAAAATAKSASSGKKEEVRACVAAFEKAQEREKAGHLRQARDQWAACARPTCIAFFRQECTTRYTQLDADIPSVVPLVTDDAGATHVDVEVTVDGELLTSKLDGRALQVDPGMHEFVFKSEAGTVTQKLMIVQGQRNRPVAVSLRSHVAHVAHAAPGDHDHKALTAAPEGAAATPEPEAAEEAPAPRLAAGPRKAEPKPEPRAASAPKKTLAVADDVPAPARKTGAPETIAAGAGAAPPDDDEPRTGASPLTYVFGAAGVVAVGASALMIYWGRKDNDMLAQCAPGCPPGDVNHIRNMYRAADISLGIGIAALTGSYLVYALTRPTGAQKPRPGADAALLFDLQPTKSGAVAAVSGRF